MVVLVLGAAVAGGVTFPKVWAYLRRKAFAKVEDRDTGILRRQAVPPSIDCSAEYIDGSYEFEASKSRSLRNERAFLTLKDGTNLFYQIWEPDTAKVKGVIFFVHGFGDHCDFLHGLKAKALSNLTDFASVSLDLPGHGRSDGLAAHMPDWFAFVAQAKEAFADHLQPLARRKWGNEVKFFALGESMGGGLLFSILVDEPTCFDGLVLNAPMLTVHDDVAPPWIVMMIFKHILVRCLPMWPIIPIKAGDTLLFSDANVFQHWDSSPYHSKLVNQAKPRLSTGFELAVTACKWMRGRMEHFDTPVLIIHGEDDKVTDPGGSEMLFGKMKHADKTMKRPKGAKHLDAFHGGPKFYNDNKVIYKEVADWLLQRS